MNIFRNPYPSDKRLSEKIGKANILDENNEVLTEKLYLI